MGLILIGVEYHGMGHSEINTNRTGTLGMGHNRTDTNRTGTLWDGTQWDQY